MRSLHGGRGPIALIGTLLLVGCSNAPGSQPSATAHSSPAATAITSLPPPPSPSLFPDRDTLVSQAGAAMSQAWRPYVVRLIPSRHVFDSIPPPPPVANMTSGKLSDAQVRDIELAVFREGALEQWADQHNEIVFRSKLMGSKLTNSPIDAAMARGDTLTVPPCDVYPSTLSVYAVDDSARAFFASLGEPTQEPILLAGTFPACTVSAISKSSGRTAKLISTDGQDTVLGAGSLVKDPVLGPIFVVAEVGSCLYPKRPDLPCAR